MKINTKYKIGDKFWAIIKNIPQESEVWRINVEIIQIWQDKPMKIEIKYNEGSNPSVLESDTFPTKKDLIKHLSK